jgi:sugar phosphate isomerase/epimerase
VAVMQGACAIVGERNWHVAMSEVTTSHWTVEQDVRAYARHGYAGIELWLNKLAGKGARYDVLPEGEVPNSEVEALASELARAQLQPCSIICAGGFTAPERERWLGRVQHLRWALRLAGRVGARVLVVVPGDLCGAPRATAIRRTVDALAEGLEDAHRYGVDIAVEPLRPVHTDFVNTIPDAVEIVEVLDDERCGLCIDTYQVWRGEKEREVVIGEIGASAPWAKHVQVADSRAVPTSKEDRLVPGEGVLPLGAMLRPLVEKGYAGWMAVEIMSRDLWNADYDELLERCKRGMKRVAWEVVGERTEA